MRELQITTALERLKSVEKFTPDAFYPGAPSESLRLEAEESVNALLDRLIPALRAPADKQLVMQEFRRTLDSFTQSDTEERERLCGYLEEIMDIAGIESSDGLLNDWLYGFDPGAVDTAPVANDDPGTVPAWSALELQIYEVIENQLAQAESRREALLALPRRLQIFYLTLIVEADVMNGGLRQFFTNLSDYVDLIAPALRELPCEAAATIFEDALAKRSDYKDPLLALSQQFRLEARQFAQLRQRWGQA